MLTALAIAHKDIRQHWRAREGLLSMVTFALATLLVLGLAFDPERNDVRAALPGALWVSILFAGTILLHRSFQLEDRDGEVGWLAIAPVDRGAVYAGKLLANFTILLALQVIVSIAFSVVFHVALPFNGPAIALTLLGSLGYVSVGTLIAAVAVGSDGGELFLAVLLLPLIVPVILGSVVGLSILLSGEPTAAVTPWLRVLLVFDVAFVTCSLLLFEYVWDG